MCENLHYFCYILPEPGVEKILFHIGTQYVETSGGVANKPAGFIA
jgi:hypothetical protein